MAAVGGLTVLLIAVTVIHTRFEVVGEMSVTRSADDLLIASDFGGFTLSIDATPRNRASNGGFNLRRTTLDGSMIHDTADDVAPLRTQLGTVGGNHGFSMVAGFPNPDGKTEADLGSLWTDGSREYVLLAIGKGGKLIMGGDYANSRRGVESRPVAPNSTLRHVSGATHVGQVAGRGVPSQLYPSTGQEWISVACDGVSLDGKGRCKVLEVRESYKVLDYADLYEQAKTHLGQSFRDLPIDGMARVEATYRYMAYGRALITVEVVALAPMTLGETGLLQSKPLSVGRDETVIRQLPGVRPINGHDFRRGVDLSKYARNERITSRDLLNPLIPPTFSLDRIVAKGETRVGFAVGYIPTGNQAGSQVARSTASAANLWDLRSTGKSYPVALSGRQLLKGDRLKVEGFRTYLTPGQADAISEAVAINQPPADFASLWS